MSDLQSHYNACLFHSGAALGRSLTRMAEANFHPIQITPTMGFILMSANEAPGISITDLATVHQLDASTISRTVDKLASDQFILRSGEKRLVQVFRTPKGRRKAAEALSAWEKLRLDYSLLLGESDVKALADLVARADAVLRSNR